MPSQAIARVTEPELVSRLAKFFPDAAPVRIPIRLSRSGGNGEGGEDGSSFLQNTVIEFGTTREVLFVVDCQLEFGDRVLVESNDGTFHAEACVVAVQYHPRQTVVAARFLKDVPNWIVKS